MTPADELRAAAQKIRDIADRASPGPWRSKPDGHGTTIEASEGHDVAYLASCTDHPGRRIWDARQIALWNPQVTELIGAWLGWIADDETEYAGLPKTPARARELATGLGIARAINGSTP